MSYIDIILIIPLLWGLYKGFSKGLIIEVASLAAFVLAVWGGIKFSDFLSEWMKNSFDWTSKYLPVISFAIIFIGILILVFSTAKLLERFVKAAALGFANKLAGGIFGMLKFGLILSVLIFVLNAIEKNVQLIPSETKHASLLYEPVGKIAPLIIPGLRESKLQNIFPDSVNVNLKVP
ncbi:MAG: CvpA family protein [Bacteroidetes bacterium]|nr:CvpA family protein [Bacteroidota bacterium]